MEASEWDHATLREEEFEQHAVYLVPDVAASPGDTNRAEASLPRNLVLKPSQALNDVRSSAKESFLETSSVRVARIIAISRLFTCLSLPKDGLETRLPYRKPFGENFRFVRLGAKWWEGTRDDCYDLRDRRIR